MDKQSYQSTLTPDQVNYFAYVGDVYPDARITNSTSRVFASLFDYSKSYVIAKVINLKALSRISNVSLSVYRKGSALFLGISAIQGRPPFSKTLFDTIVPINPKSTNFPSYPSSDEVLEFDVHFIDTLTNDLTKVVSLLPECGDFTHSLVAEYQALRGERYSPESYANSVAKFFAQSFSERQKDCLFSSSCSILKSEPVKDEPKLTGVPSLSELLSMEDDNEALGDTQ